MAIWVGAIGPVWAQGRSIGASTTAALDLSDPGKQRHELNSHEATWIDAGGQANGSATRAVARRGEFTSAAHSPPVLLEHQSALWQRIEVRATAAPWYLQVNSPSVDSVSLHWEDDQGTWQVASAGDGLAVSQWPLPDHNPLFKLPINLRADADGVGELWLRVQHARVPVSLTSTLMSESALRQQRELYFLIFGAFMGCTLLVLVMCLYHTTVHKDRVFVAYGGITLSMAAMQSQLTGLAGMTFWSNLPALNDRASFAFAEIYALMGIVFMSVACGVTWRRSRLGKVLIAWLITGVSITVMHQIFFNRQMFIAANIYMPVSMLLALMIALLAHKRGDRYALRLGLGLFPVIVAGSLPLLRNQGVIETGVLSQYALMLGALIELSFLMVVLTYRSQDLRETSLRERALVSTDALTGLTHETLFLERLHGANVRARRYKKQFGLLILSLDNVSQLGREGGFAGPERAVLLAASRLRGIARDIDTPCRVAHDELALLIEGPLTAAALTDIATRVLARMLRPATELPNATPLSTHITATLLPSTVGIGIGQESAQGLSAAQSLQWMLAESRAFNPDIHKAVRMIEARQWSSIT